MNTIFRRPILLLGLCLVMAGVGLGLIHYRLTSNFDSLSSEELTRQEMPPLGAWLEAREQQINETLWSKEMLAQEYGRVFEALWDSLNAATNKLGQAANFPFGKLILGTYSLPELLAHHIERYEPAGAAVSLSPAEWRHWITQRLHDGWQMENTEFRHHRFELDESGQPRLSHFYFSAHLSQPRQSRRAQVNGNLVVHWMTKRTPHEPIVVKAIDASHLTLCLRQGEPVYQPILIETVNPSDKSTYMDPLILYDLNGDGLSEIILAARNLVYRRRGPDRYGSEPLCKHSPGLMTTAVIADFDGDSTADLMGARSEGLVLFKGSSGGDFSEPGRLVWRASSGLQNAMVLTCGDIDHDHDLDVFIGQYRVPTFAQVLRPNYFSANDGHSSYLLLNDGQGGLTDITQAAGLGDKRWRRIYSSSLADLNNDGHLDLMVVSDFAGIDLYQNDGSGRFTDVTARWIAEPHAFGMAHALHDFNLDGRIDFIMIGMPSPTVDRLEFLELRRLTPGEDPSMRSRMSYGNRLYLAQPGGGFEQTSLNDSVARSGWSWGCSAFDFNNDSYPDLYIANGLESRQSVRDYEPEFWLHDLHVDLSVDDREAGAYFMNKYSRTRGQGWSYGGYEKNRLYLNQGGEFFLEVAHLMGVGLEEDCRNVATDDLDGDGRMDLLLTTLEYWPEAKQTLRIYRNNLPDSGNWIGFRLREEGGESPVGVKIRVQFDGKSIIKHIVTGDSHRSQHANTLHFGLGTARQVDQVKIQWASGKELMLPRPDINRYHSLHAPITENSAGQ